MNACYKYGLIFLLLAFSLGIQAQVDPDKVCRVEGGRIIFKLDLQWNNNERKKVASLFDLDSALLAKAYSGINEFTVNGIKWKIKKLNARQIELSMPIETIDVKKDVEKSKKEVKINNDFVFLMEDNWLRTPNDDQRENAVYGVNSFKGSSIFQYRNGAGKFYLPGFKNAKKVYLAGSFNNWSTNQTLMQLTDSGWVASIKLPPGKHTYKYIADGKWMTDPNNKHNEDDGYGNINSFVFCYNYNFELKGYLNAKKVVLAGSFNDWNERELKMTKTNNGWTLPLYLKNGTHTYKFIVDNEWMTDPANKAVRNDGSGNYNSVIGIGEAYVFKLKGYTGAKHVYLAGNFNGWNSGELPMNKTPDGWELSYILAPGNYEYKFMTDGKWMKDPDNPYSIGSGDMENSVLAFKPNHTFILSKYPNAKKVIVTGNFNDWSTVGYSMTKKNGVWTIPVYLRQGKCTYKFIVDGQWILDPDNKLWEENEYSTGNSLLWIGTKQ